MLDQYTALEMLSSLEKFKKYVESANVFERQAAGRMLCDTALDCDTKDEFSSAMMYVSRLSVDPEPSVRAELIEKIPGLVKICNDKLTKLDLDASLIEDEILPLVINYLEDVTNNVRKTAQAALVAILDMFSHEVCHKKILPNIIALSSKQNDDHRTEAVILLAKLCPILGEKITVEEILPEYIKACQDELFHVRKVAAQQAPEVAKQVGPSVTESMILPHFAGLAEDVVWGVRKACSDSMAALSEHVSAAVRDEQLCPMFVDLLNDESRWVRISSYQELGKFIATFAKPNDSNDESFVVEEAEFNAAKFWKEQLPEVDFDALLLDEEPPPASVAEKAAEKCNSSDDSEADQDHSALPEADQDIATEEQKKQTFEQSIKNNIVFVDNDEDVPINYAEGDESHGSLLNHFTDMNLEDQTNDANTSDPFDPEKMDDDDVDIELPGNNRNSGYNAYLGNDDGFSASSLRSDTPDDLDGANDHIEPQDVIPEVLLKYFIWMTTPKKLGNEFHDSELARHCAFSLPGVALTLGKKNWKCLRQVYSTLANDVQWKVRRTLASSIHEIAKILGENLTVKELEPIFRTFLSDLDEVRLGLLCHISDFLALTNEDVKSTYLTKMSDFLTTDNIRNWRFRLTLAYQLSKVISLYTPQQVFDHHVPIVIKLLHDQIAAVRIQGAHLAAAVARHLKSDKNNALHIEFIQLLISHTEQESKDHRWLHRTVFCYFSAACMHPALVPFPAEEDAEGGVLDEERDYSPVLTLEEFIELLMPTLVNLSRDSIVNIRICAARCLKAVRDEEEYLRNFDNQETKTLENIFKQLATDKDRDVKMVVQEWIEDGVEDYQDDDDEEDDVIQHLTPEELDDMVQNLNNSESEDLSYKPLSPEPEIESVGTMVGDSIVSTAVPIPAAAPAAIVIEDLENSPPEEANKEELNDNEEETF